MKKVFIILGTVIVVELLVIVLLPLGIKTDVKLIGDAEEKVTVLTTYVDKGISVQRHEREVPTKKYRLKVNSDVDTSKLGKYKVEYEIKYLRKKYKLTRNVEVVDDVKPELNVNLDSIMRDYCTKKNTKELTYTASDNFDGELTDKISVTEENSNLIISVKDAAGNESTKILPISYTEKPSPIFILNGNSTVYVPVGGKYTENGTKYTDGCGNNVDIRVNQTGNVDTSKVGTYEIIYNYDGKTLRRKVVVYNPSSSSSSGGDKTIYLTFDDGPCSYTSSVLNTLDKYGVKATFFVTNQFSSYAYMLREEYNRGHVVAVHTYTHKWNVYSSVDAYISDFNKMNDLIYSYTGARSRIFRFPGGSSNTISRSYASGVVTEIARRMTSDGYVYFDWNVDSGDAAGYSQKGIYNSVVNGVERCNTCVVLMHDIQKNTVNELDNILNTLVGKGYRFGVLTPSSPTVHHSIAN